LKWIHLQDSLAAGVEESGFEKLPISFSDAEAAAALATLQAPLFQRGVGGISVLPEPGRRG